MKKIGILTYFLGFNYGATLQAYALADFLNSSGFQSKVIHFIPKIHIRTSHLFVLPRSRKAIKENILSFLTLIYQLKRKRGFEDFIDQCIPLSSEKNISENDIPSTCEQFDAVICGSDQIWNPRLKGAVEGFFLPHGKGFRRIAYAPSIGNGHFNEYPEINRIKQFIANFDYLSVRDKASQKELESCFSIKADTVVDPTLLANREAFFKIAAPGQTKRQFIFLYSVKMSKKTIQAARDLSNRTGLPVLSLFSGRASLSWLRNKDLIPGGKVGPQEFLAYIRDAEYVITDSFHGCVFSLIFQKKFFIIKNEDLQGNLLQDERINTLCDIFNIKNRFIKANDIKYISLECNIDWNEIESLRQKYAEDSKKFLLNALSDTQ